MGHHGSKRGVMIYLPDPLHRWLKARAALDGTSLSAVIEGAARVVYPDSPASESSTPLARERVSIYHPAAGSDRARRSRSERRTRRKNAVSRDGKAQR